MTPTDEGIKIAVAAATANGRTNYTQAARALHVPRAWLCERLGVAETRGAPVSLTLEAAVKLWARHPSMRAAATKAGIAESTLRGRVHAAAEAAGTTPEVLRMRAIEAAKDRRIARRLRPLTDGAGEKEHAARK